MTPSLPLRTGMPMNRLASQSAPWLQPTGSILLLSCYEQGHQPLGIAWPAAHLERAGFAPRLLDLSVHRLEEAHLQGAGGEPVRFVGLSVPMHTALTLAVRAARRIRALAPRAHRCFFGLYAWLNQDALLADAADSVIGGEVEAPLSALVRMLDALGPEGPLPELPGVGFPGRPQPAALGRTEWIAPARGQLMDQERYARLALADRPESLAVGYVEASRGCKHLCRHCPLPPVYGGRFFAVPERLVLEEIDARIAEGARHITFGDPDFLNGPTHALRIARGLHERHPVVTFDFTAKVEHLLRRPDLLPEFKSLGALFVTSAVESLSDRVLRILDKGHTTAQAREALRVVRGAGIAFKPTFVAFTPWTALEDYLELLKWVGREGLTGCVDPVQLTLRLLVPPRSLLLDTPEFARVRATPDPEAFTTRWEHPDPRMDALQARVAALAEQAAQHEQPHEEVFAVMLEAALETAGRPTGAPEMLAIWPGAPPAPRLTESWFC